MGSVPGSALAPTVSTRVTTASSDCCGYPEHRQSSRGSQQAQACEEPKELAGDQDAIAEPPSLFQGGDKRRRGQF